MASLWGRAAIVVGAGMGGLAAAAAVADSLVEVEHLLKPGSALRNPELVQRAEAIMAEA